MKGEDQFSERVIHCLWKLIREKGFKGWNMDELAYQSGITKRTLYKKIESKERIIEAAIIKSIDSNQEQLLELSRKSMHYRERLHRIVKLLPDLIFGMNSPVYGDAFREYPSLESKVINKRKVFIERFEKFLNEGVDSGIIIKQVQPLEMIELIQAVVLYYIKFVENPQKMRKKAQRGLEILIRGFLCLENREEWI